MREYDYKPVIIDHMSLISSTPSGSNYYDNQQWFEHIRELAKIYNVSIITGVQKQKFALGKLKPLNLA